MPAAPIDHRTVNAARQRLRQRLWRAQFGRCGICGGRIRAMILMTLDHVVPVARDGPDDGNRVVAHHPCNVGKADRMPTGCELIWLLVANRGLEIE